MSDDMAQRLQFQQRSAELDYFLKLLPLSSLNVPEISWTVYESYPGYVVLQKKVSPYMDDEFSITPTIWGDGTGVWEITGQRVLHERNTGDPAFRTSMALPLRSNSHIIATLDTLVNKAVIACAPRSHVAATGTMSFDPVEGEPDYVKPVSDSDSESESDPRACGGLCDQQPCRCAAD
jgi:hypothetical protein